MNSRFALPVATALTVHASLLFGFRHSPYTPPVSEPPPVVTWVPISMPPEEVEVVRTTEPEPPKGSPDARPDTEPAVSPLVPPVFTIDQRPPGPTPLDPKKAVTWESYGVPNGPIDGGPLFPSSSLDNPPNARLRVPPDYPFSAKKDGTEGEVTVEFGVDETGHVFNPVVTKSSNHIFDEPSVRAVLKWRFAPGKRAGQTVRFRMAVPLVYRLGDE